MHLPRSVLRFALVALFGSSGACKPDAPPTTAANASDAIAPPSAAPATPPTPIAPEPSEDEPPVVASSPPRVVAVTEAVWLAGDGQPQILALVREDGVRLIDPQSGQEKIIDPGGGAISLVSTHTARAGGPAFLAIRAGKDALSLWRADGTLVTRFPWAPPGGVEAIALSKDATRAALLRESRVVVGMTNGAAGDAPLADLTLDSPAFEIALHDDGRHLVLASSALVTVFDLTKRARVGDPHGTDTGGTFATVLSPDGRWAAASTAAGHGLTVYQTHPWRVLRKLGTAPDCQNHVSCAFSSDARTLHGAAGQAWSKTFAAGTWRVIRAANPGKGAKDTYTSLSENGQIGLRGESPRVELFDTKTKGAVGSLDVAPEQSVRLSPDGTWIVRFGPKGFDLFESRGLHPVVSPAK